MFKTIISFITKPNNFYNKFYLKTYNNHKPYNHILCKYPKYINYNKYSKYNKYKHKL